MSKRLLFVTAQFPYPPQSGGALRAYGLIDGLARRGHAITLLSFVEPGQATEETPLAARCEAIHTVPPPTRSRLSRLRDLALGRADMERRLWSPRMLGSLRGLLAKKHFDVVHFEGLEMAAYLQRVWKQVLDDSPQTMLIYDAFNAEADLQRRIARQDFRTLARLPVALYSFIQANRLDRFESLICLSADHVFAVSRADAIKLAQFRQETPITVIPNAIQADQYHREDTPSSSIVQPALVFTGKMDYRPNVDAALWFAGDILPRIRQAVPGAHLTIVGQQPHARLGALAKQAGVTITGRVPDVKLYLDAAQVFVVPMRMGSGTRFKVLEAMAMNCAVVSTRLGAEGLDIVDGEHLILADTPESFADAVIDLLQDEDRRLLLGKQAATHIREAYDWQVLIPQVEALYPD